MARSSSFVLGSLLLGISVAVVLLGDRGFFSFIHGAHSKTANLDPVVPDRRLDSQSWPRTFLAFDDLARVRVSELVGSDSCCRTVMGSKDMACTCPLAEPVVSAMMDAICPRFTWCDLSGASKKQWEDMILKVIAFDASCKTQDSCLGTLSYKGFLNLKRASDWNPDFQYTLRTESKQVYFNDKIEPVVEWLTSKKGYWGQWARPLAQAFLDTHTAYTIADELEVFVSLDTDHDGALSLKEVMAYIEPQQELMIDALLFSAVARVQAEDFEAIGLPSNVATSIMALGLLQPKLEADYGLGIDASIYKELALVEVVSEFVRRDYLDLTSVHKDVKDKINTEADVLDGTLKFYQLADALPNLTEGMGKTDRRVTIHVQGIHSVNVRIPLFADVVTGAKGISSEDVEKWLTDDMDVKNGWSFLTGNKFKYAKKLADNAVAWAAGQVEDAFGQAVRRQRVNVDFTWDATTWRNTAGRLALFATLDKSPKDGKVEFKEAHYYLKQWLECFEEPPPNPKCSEEVLKRLKVFK